MPDLSLTLEMLEAIRGYAMLGLHDPYYLFKLDKYLVWRLERAGAAVPTPWELDEEPARDRDPTDEYDYLAELIDLGGEC